MRDLTQLGASRVFDGIFVVDTIRVYIACKNLSYIGKIALVPMWVRMVLTQIRTRVYEDSLTLTNQTSIFDWYCHFVTSGRFFDIVNYVDY